MVKDLAFAAYSVRDVPAAITFYRDVMGFTPGEIFSEQWAEFTVGSMSFGIGNGEPLGIAPGSSFALVFEVDDLSAERERLVAAGVPVTEIMDAPHCRSAFVTDPEGNTFGIHQRKT